MFCCLTFPSVLRENINVMKIYPTLTERDAKVHELACETSRARARVKGAEFTLRALFLLCTPRDDAHLKFAFITLSHTCDRKQCVCAKHEIRASAGRKVACTQIVNTSLAGAAYQYGITAILYKNPTKNPVYYKKIIYHYLLYILWYK